MTVPSPSRPRGERRQAGIYVYGVFPADIELTAGLAGVGDPPGWLRVVRYGDLAALISEVDLDGPLGSPDDLAIHKDILDRSAAEVPVLPMRFGAVLYSEEAVADELLRPHHDEFARSLAELDGRTQYIVKGRYAEDSILAEVLAEDPQASRLARQISGTDPAVMRDARILLGERISRAIDAKRHDDTRLLGDWLAGHCAASVVRAPTHDLDAVHVALLLEPGQDAELDQVLASLAQTWAGRIELRLLGPMAAYDFAASQVGAHQAGG
jgi:hypothetical protein